MPGLKKKQKLEFPKEFTLKELTRSDTAKRLGIANQPEGAVLENMKITANKLVKVRELLITKSPTVAKMWPDGFSTASYSTSWNPMYISSGYRSPELNAHIPGSSNTSAHTLGWAVDFKCPGFGTPYEIVAKIAASPLMDEVDQLIYEYGSWVHISFDPRNRKQVLTIDKKGTREGLHR